MGEKECGLDSPRGRLVELGTEFGVSVGPSGDTDGPVLEGKVAVFTPRLILRA